MTADGSGSGADGGEPQADVGPTEAELRRRRARVFGDVLPDVTGDERGEGEGSGDGDRGDEWLRRQVPPHHG